MWRLVVRPVLVIVALAVFAPGVSLAQADDPPSDPFDEGARLISVARMQFISPPFMQLFDGTPYMAFDDELLLLLDFLPRGLGLDAMQLSYDEPYLVFSTVNSGFAVHDGGVIHLFQNRAYRVDEGGLIEPYEPLAGLSIRTLDALALLPDYDRKRNSVDGETWLFSVGLVETIIQDGVPLILYPANIYRFDGELIELFEPTGLLGIDDVDALHAGMMDEPCVEFSTARSQVIATGDGFRQLGSEKMYALISLEGRLLEQAFDGLEYGLDTLDAFTGTPDEPSNEPLCPCFGASTLESLGVTDCDASNYSVSITLPDGRVIVVDRLEFEAHGEGECSGGVRLQHDTGDDWDSYRCEVYEETEDEELGSGFCVEEWSISDLLSESEYEACLDLLDDVIGCPDEGDD